MGMFDDLIQKGWDRARQKPHFGNPGTNHGIRGRHFVGEPIRDYDYEERCKLVVEEYISFLTALGTKKKDIEKLKGLLDEFYQKKIRAKEVLKDE